MHVAKCTRDAAGLARAGITAAPYHGAITRSRSATPECYPEVNPGPPSPEPAHLPSSEEGPSGYRSSDAEAESPPPIPVERILNSVDLPRFTNIDHAFGHLINTELNRSLSL